MHEIFEPLRRGNMPDDGGDRASLGLGLFIVREIARAHGGDIQVLPTERGTLFTLTLPREEPESVANVQV